MSVTRGLIWIIGIILVLYFIFPNAYVNAKNAVCNIDDPSNLKYKETGDGQDYGKLFLFLDCNSDEDCEKYYNIPDIQCSMNKTCVVYNTPIP